MKKKLKEIRLHIDEYEANMDFDTMMPHVLACGQETKQQLAGNLQKGRGEETVTGLFPVRFLGLYPSHLGTAGGIYTMQKEEFISKFANSLWSREEDGPEETMH